MILDLLLVFANFGGKVRSGMRKSIDLGRCISLRQWEMDATILFMGRW